MKFDRVLCIVLAIILVIGGLQYSCVKVSAKQTYDSIDIEQKLMVMMVGDKYKLQTNGYYYLFGKDDCASVDMISNASWKSSNTKVATIDKKGVITAIKTGKCIITATYGKKTAKCKVIVYTERALYEQVLDADMSHDTIYMALTTDYYKNYDILYYNADAKEIAVQREKAAKKVKKIIASVVKDDMCDYEKMMALAGWIVNNIEVDNDYTSEFTERWLYGYNMECYYMDALLYGKAKEIGVSYLFQLLLYTCGIKCEHTGSSLDYKTEDGNLVEITDSIVINLDGNYYYFNIAKLADDLADYNYENETQYSFYDMIVPNYSVVDVFTKINTCEERKECYKEKRQVRSSNYNYFGQNCTSTVGLFNANKVGIYDCYYYDFYKGSNRFITLKETSGKELYSICPTPIFSTIPIYPDSTSSKYKKPMKALADMNGKINDIVDELNSLKAWIKSGNPVFPSEISEVKTHITTVETEFENGKDTFCDSNAVKYIESKIKATKDKYAILETKYNETASGEYE